MTSLWNYLNLQLLFFKMDGDDITLAVSGVFGKALFERKGRGAFMGQGKPFSFHIWSKALYPV